jgi:hypothetical protein
MRVLKELKLLTKKEKEKNAFFFNNYNLFQIIIIYISILY